jgi:hypothetical protein
MASYGIIGERRIWSTPVLLRRARRLPVDGRVVVREQGILRPEDIVARGEREGSAIVIPVAKALRLGSHPVEPCLLCRPGDAVAKDEVIARKKGALGLGGHSCLSPVAGKFASGPVGSGEYLVTPAPTEIEIKAHYPGLVVSLIPQRGIAIQLAAVGAQGLVGVGGETGGPIRVLAGPREAISAGRIVPRLAGCIIIGGQADLAALRRATALGAAGLVIGTLRASVFASYLAEPQRIPLVVIDGFGTTGMSPAVHDLLRLNEGKDARLTANEHGTDGLDGPEPPEILIPVDSREAVRVRPLRLGLGSRVRIVGGHDGFATATVTAIGATPVRFDSGLVADWVDVQLDDERHVRVPLTNVELFDEPTPRA